MRSIHLLTRLSSSREEWDEDQSQHRLLTPALQGCELMIFRSQCRWSHIRSAVIYLRSHVVLTFSFILSVFFFLSANLKVTLKALNAGSKCVLEAKSSLREFSYVFTNRSTCGCSVGAPSHLHPSVPEFFYMCLLVNAAQCTVELGPSLTSCTPKSFQQSCHMQVGGSLSITQIAEWEAYHQVQPNHLICFCSMASLPTTEDFMVSSSLMLVSEDECA